MPYETSPRRRRHGPCHPRRYADDGPGSPVAVRLCRYGPEGGAPAPGGPCGGGPHCAAGDGPCPP